MAGVILQSHPCNPFYLISGIRVQTRPLGNLFLLILVLLQMPQPMTMHISPLLRPLQGWGGLLYTQGCTRWANPSGIKLELDLTSLASGLYLLHFDQLATPYKLIKQ